MKPEQFFEYIAWTDGACQPNPGNGGWGAIIKHHGKETVLQGSDPNATNNTMEMTAALEAMRYVPDGGRILIYADSKYVIKGATQWMPAWKRHGWKRGKNMQEDVKNADLWRSIDKEMSRIHVHWRWVRGHSGDVMNDRVDAIAVGARMDITYAPIVDIGEQHMRSICRE